MILEERVKGVSNRCSKADKTKKTQYLTEISSAIKGIRDSYQEEPEEPILELDDLGNEYLQLEEIPQPTQESFYQEEKQSFQQLEDYQESEQEETQQEESSHIMDNEEAQETVQEHMIAVMLGNKENISYQKNENLKNWIITHSTELRLFEQLSVIRTGNVNYNQIF